MVITETVREVLKSSALAHLVTLDADGGPHVSMVWVDLDRDEIVAGHLGERRKVHNIRRDHRVALSFETSGHDEHGLVEHLVIYGTARISAGGASALLQRLAHTYLGPDIQFPPAAVARPGYVTHITIDRIAGVGPWDPSKIPRIQNPT